MPRDKTFRPGHYNMTENGNRTCQVSGTQSHPDVYHIKAHYICLLFCFLLSYRDSETEGDSYVRKSAKGLTILRTQSEYLS